MIPSFVISIVVTVGVLVGAYQTDEHGRLHSSIIAADKPTTVSFNFGGSNLLNIMAMLVSMDPELASLFERKDVITALVPFDPAFRKTPLESLLPRFANDEWRAHRRDFVLFHLYSGDLDPSQMPLGPPDNLSITMLNGDIATLEIQQQKTYLNGDARVLTYSISNPRRPVYMLQRVLSRPWFDQTVLDVAHSKFQRLAVTAGIEEQLRTDAAVTLFLPPPNAFDDFNPSMTQEDLAFLLRFHIIPNKIIPLEDLVTPGRIQITNVVGHALIFDTIMEIVTVDGVELASKQQLALNGIVHVIDRLLPKMFEPSNKVAEGLVKRDGTASLLPAGVGDH